MLHFQFFCILSLVTLFLPSCSSAPTTMLTAVNTTMPGCLRKCKNMTIPYPFGVGAGCAMTDKYVISCDAKTEDEQFINISDTQVIVRGGAVVSESCPTGKGSSNFISLEGRPYSISPTANMLTVTGCDHYGMILEQGTKPTNQRHVSSCLSMCYTSNDVFDTRCEGIGCCKAFLPKGVQSLVVRLGTIDNVKANLSRSCSYAFIAKNSSFKFEGVFNFKRPGYADKLQKLPLVYEWFVVSNSCRSAQQNSSSYACKENTKCIDVYKTLKVKGYRCSCLPGYEGNPYLGCTDYDECATNPCLDACENTLGGYKCHCPTGFHGDGKKYGSGCIPSSLWLALTIGLAVGLGSIVLLIGGYWGYGSILRRKEIKERAKNFKRNGGLLLQQRMSSKEGMAERTRFFTSDELDKATNHFTDDRVLGRGGQGTVYKGMLSDGSMVAVKKHKTGSLGQLGEFINEIAILSELNHRNIVRLLGCCLETHVPLLVYEFIPNGTLSKHIHDPQEEFPITWEMRLQIALDVAGAVTYLHSFSSTPILHKDIKTANILLDAKFRAKLSDFGTSRSIDLDKSHLTTQVQGTFGYLDPEYFQSSRYNEKSDVYSFGVVLVELLTGKKAVFQTESDSGVSLVSCFLEAMENSTLHEIVADRVANEAKEDIIVAIAKLAKECLNMDGTQRPTMRQVYLELETIRTHEGTPISFHKRSTATMERTLTESTADASEGDDILPCSDEILPVLLRSTARS